MKLQNVIRTQKVLAHRLNQSIPETKEAKLDLFTVAANRSKGQLAVYQTYLTKDSKYDNDLELVMCNNILAYKFGDGDFALDFKAEETLSIKIDMSNESKWYHDEEQGYYIFTEEYDNEYNKFYHLSSLVDYRHWMGKNLLKIELLNNSKVSKLKIYAKEPIMRGLSYFYIERFRVIDAEGE